jgi:protein TonB
MAPIVKDVENSAATTAPAAPAIKPPQPVALEVPVTVNGARTVDGSDKREPFSEPTKTVLIFGHGAVIRLASLVAPGQLLFVTNEKSKKEVVCQVVKSKNYRTVTGYVELEFTEPAVGFWGMRFPADRVSPAPATSTGSVAPIAHSPAQHPAASAPSAVPTPPKIAPAPPAPASMKPAAPAPVPAKPVATAPPVAPPLAKPLPSKPQQPVASHSASPVASHPAPSAPPVSPVFAQTVASKPPLTPAASTSSNTETTSPAQQPPQTIPAIPSANPTTDELKQHTARLQEQLSSMLFTEAPATKAPTPEKPAAPKQDMIPTETVQKILQLSQPEVRPPSPVGPVPETRPTPASMKPGSVSMSVEEVKIPAWLAPLARETDALPAEATVEGSAIAEANSSSAATQEDALPLEGDAVSSKIQHPMFGEQLLGTSSEGAPTSSSGGSKKGLLIGLAAAGLLVIGGGAWYAKQPGNALSGLFAPKPAATQPQTAQNSSETASKPAFRPETAAIGGPAGPSSNLPPASKPLTPAPISASSSAVNSTAIPAISKETTSEPHNAPPVAPQPKKPVLGEVRLATPSVNRAANSAQGGEAAPSIDASQPSSGAPLTLSASHSKEPTAPLPIGGDVVSAKLLKSVPPVYPPAARSQRVGGDVKIDALIDISGNVSTMKVISGPTLLHQAAMSALKQWKYEPAKLDGNPTPMHLTVIVQFRLQ